MRRPFRPGSQGLTLGLVFAAFSLVPRPVPAADHADGPAAAADPTADIADVYATMSSDATKVNLIMTMARNVSATTRFSDAVQYVFHTTSKMAFGDASGFDLAVICEFDASQRVSCWAGDEYVTGDATNRAGILSTGGKMRVFADRARDAFFFNLAGFRATTAAVTAAASSLTFDAAGCPALDAATATALVTSLSRTSGGPAVNAFAGENILALVVQIDKSVLTQGGPIIGVWAATHRR